MRRLFSYFMLLIVVTFYAVLVATANSSPSWGFIDLENEYNPSSALHIRRSVCNRDESFYPSIITSFIQKDEEGKFATSAKYLDPEMIQLNSGADSQGSVFIWTSPDKPSALRLDTCSGDQTDGRLCRAQNTREAGMKFFDAAPIYRSNEFVANKTRLVVSSEKIDAALVTGDLAAIGLRECGNEACLPYFMYVDHFDRCQLGCRPYKWPLRRNAQLCNEPVKPNCALVIEDTVVFGNGQPAGSPKTVNLTFPELSPINVTLRCQLPPGRKLSLCGSSVDQSAPICDPEIIIKKNGSAFFKSSDDFHLNQVGFPVLSISIGDDLLSLNVTLSFTSNLFKQNLNEPKKLSGVYSFELSFEGVAIFDPHRDGVPVVNVRASGNTAASIAGLDTATNCLLSSGDNNYRGKHNVVQCENPDYSYQQCLPWTEGFGQSASSPPETEYIAEAQAGIENAENYCRSPRDRLLPAPKRPWCWIGKPRKSIKDPRVNDSSSWAYCDIMYCDEEKQSPVGYLRFNNRDCVCADGYEGPATSDVFICRDFCNADPQCKGFVVDDRGSCTIKRCLCSGAVSRPCDNQVPKSYYMREVDDIPSPYADGSNRMLVEVHNFVDGSKDRQIGCSLFWRGDELDTATWQVFDQETGQFVVDTDETMWKRDASIRRFILTLPTITASLNNRLYRCVKGSRSQQFEYHLIKIYQYPQCTLRFNQLLSPTFDFQDRGIEVRLSYEIDMYWSSDIQLDVTCKSSAALGFCSKSNGQLCVPLAIAYENRLPVANSFTPSKTKVGLRFSYAPVSKSSPDEFHYSVFFPAVNKTASPYSQYKFKTIGMVLHYPQLQLPLITGISGLESQVDYVKIYRNVPRSPLAPTGYSSPSELAMTCMATVGFSKSSNLTVFLHVPTPIIMSFVCETKPTNPSASFCFESSRSAYCYPVDLVLMKDDKEIYRTNWMSPDKKFNGVRSDNSSLSSPKFSVASEASNKLALQMAFNNDPLDMTNSTRREELIAGNYRLGFVLGKSDPLSTIHDTGANLTIIIPPKKFNGTGSCRPMYGESVKDGWLYTGTEVKAGRCSKQQCLPWADTMLAGELAEFKDNWKQQRPDLKYLFESEESGSYCRTPSLDSLRHGPICATGVENGVVLWEKCDIPVCIGEEIYSSHYERIAGRCICNGSAHAANPDMEPYLESHRALTFEGCQRQCEENSNCVGFNYEETLRMCDLKSCRCADDTLIECPRYSSSDSVWHYFRKRTVVALDQLDQNQNPALVFVHPVEANLLPFTASCNLPQTTGSNVNWDIIVSGQAYPQDSAEWNQLGFEVSPDKKTVVILQVNENHNNLWLRCNDGDKFQAHLIVTNSAPQCSFSVNYGSDNNKEPLVTDTGYEVNIRSLDMTKLQQIPGTLHARCHLGTRKFGVCPDAASRLCNPLAKVYVAGNRLYTSSSRAESNSELVDVKWTEDDAIINFAIRFPNNMTEALSTAITFRFLPQTQPLFPTVDKVSRLDSTDAGSDASISMALGFWLYFALAYFTSQSCLSELFLS